MQSRFKVTKQYGRGPETSLDKRFGQLQDAQSFVNEMLIEDVSLNVQATYRIYEFDEVQAEYDSSKVDVSTLAPKQTENASGSQGKGSTASFRPTPLNTTPRPPGTPPNWMKNDGDEEEKEKK
jgi:hypothetical protein